MHIYRFFFADREEIALERVRQVVEQHTLYAASPKTFNDPFEFKLKIKIPTDQDRIRKRYFKDQPGHSEEDFEIWKRSFISSNNAQWMQDSIREECLEKFGVICFTTNPCNHLLWSHYGPSHLSFCAAFELGELLKLDGYLASGLIHYSNKLHSLDCFSQNVSTIAKHLFFKKSVEWKYEKEFRIVLKNKGEVKFPVNALKSIVLGCRAHQCLRNYARKSLDNGKYKWEQMVECSDDYSLKQCLIEKNCYLMTSHF